MKHSPLCTRDDGKEVYFTVDDGDTKYRFTLSTEMLDDECGDAATEADRKAWVQNNLAHILNVRPEGAPFSPPFNRVIVEEIS